MSSPINRDRDQLILEYYPMVRQVAYRMARRFPQWVDVDDLINIGLSASTVWIGTSPTVLPRFLRMSGLCAGCDRGRDRK